MLEFIAYNDGKAISVYNRKNMMICFHISTFIAIPLSLLALIYIEFLLVIWIPPVIFLFFSYLSIAFVKYDNYVFLKYTKKKHHFIITNDKFIRDGKEIKKFKKCKIYKYKKYLLIEFNRSFYLIYNSDYIKGNRKLLLKRLHYNNFTKKFIPIIYKCDCCGYYTIYDKGYYEICPVCGWEDDSLERKSEDENLEGPNFITLTEAKENYRKYGSCDKKTSIFFNRKPRKIELDYEEKSNYE